MQMESKATSPDPWLTAGHEKRSAVQQMFSEIAPTYDRCNAILSLRLHHRWRKAAVDKLHLRAGDTVLDACCGTGDFLDPLRKVVGAQGKIFAYDFCFPMLARADQKDPAAGLALGDACRAPFQSASFEGVTVGWGIRNVPDQDLAHQEAYRVLKPGGRFVSVDMAIPRNPIVRGVSKFVFHTLSPALGALFGAKRAYKYLPESTERFMTREQLAKSMAKAGFVEVQWKDFFFGTICMHWGKKL